MRITTVTQQPAERRRYSIDYTEALDVGDFIESVSVNVTPEGLTVQAFHSENRVRLSVEGGQSGATYKVEITTTTTAGNEIFEDEFFVRVKEI